MKHGNRKQRVVQQELALDVYLKNLLDGLPAEDRAGDTYDDGGARAPIVKLIATKAETDLVSDRLESVADVQDGVQQLATGPCAEIPMQPLSVMPEWSQQEFQALFFRIEQLILATPLTELLRAVKFDRTPTKIPGQPSWFLGLLDERDGRIGVLDTGQLVFGKTRGEQRDLERHPFQRILITRDGRWGLGCDEILSISRLQPEKVRWRTLRKKRPWLVGTVIEELTAVIDVQQLLPHRKRH